MMARDFTKTRAWQTSNESAIAIYRLTKSFPREETYGLTSQLRRAAISVPAVIAEGANRSGNKEYLRFLSVAAGSMAETKCLLQLARRLGYISEQDYAGGSALAEQTSKMIRGLIRSVQGKV